MSYGFGGNTGYPPQQGGYPPGQQPGYPSAYPPTGGGGYPPAPSTGGGGYPPAPSSGGYPPTTGGYPAAGGYPPANTGYGAAPGGYPPSSAPYAPPSSMYPAASMPYGPSTGIGFEGVTNSIVQPSAQNYGFNPPQPSGYGGYPPASAPSPAGMPGGYPSPQHAPPSAPSMYGQPSAPMHPNTSQYGQQPPYGQPPSTAPPQQQYGHPPKQQAPSPYSSHPSASPVRMQTQGTVRPASGFHAESDAKTLRKAMKGLGTDERSIIGVIGYRSVDQRLKIKNCFKQAFGRDLIKDLKSELSGNFEELSCALMMEPREYDAYCLHKAMDGLGTTETTLIEILASRSNSEIHQIKDWYHRMYKRVLEKEVSSETSGHFRKLLVSLQNGGRDESMRTDVRQAQQDAQALYQAGEKRWGTDEATFNLVMSTRNFAQLNLVFAEYQKVAHRDIIKSIQSEFSGDVEDGMCAVVDIARNPSSYFAKRLYRSMKGLGTNDNTLIRVVVSRCEVDMVQIKQQFRALYKQDLANFISGDTSGDYKKLLLALVGN